MSRIGWVRHGGVHEELRRPGRRSPDRAPHLRPLPAIALAALLASACAAAQAASTPRPLAVSHASNQVVQPQPRPGSCHTRGRGSFAEPDAHCTPGAISPAVTQSNLDRTICRSGYTRTVRPSESITEREKQASMASYGDSGSPHDYEYDHLVPLELGGATNDSRNLWPEPAHTPNSKDKLEGRLREMVCAGRLRLATAQSEIAHDWVATYRKLDL